MLRDHRAGRIRPRLPGRVRHRGDRHQPDRAPRRPRGPEHRAAARGPAHAARQRGHRADRVRARRAVRDHRHDRGGHRPGAGYPDQIVTKVVFLLVPGLHLLDLAGPAQVFGTAADLGCGYELAYVAETDDVPSAQGITVKAAVQWPALVPDDLVIVPGWRSGTGIAGTGPLAGATLKALAAHHAQGGTVASVCAGADALGRA